MSDDEWVKDAMTDEAVVAHMLLRLHTAQPPPLPPTAPSRPALHLGWTVRQRRSRSAPRHGDGKKKAEAARASPTTPLSWSGGTSVSGGVLDGFEESSRPAKPTDGSRSKVTVTCQTTTTTITKRARKKKSLAELREEESLLLKEKRKLKNELTTLRLTLEKQRSANESLKRIKLDVQSQQTIKATTAVASEEAISDQPQEREEVFDPASIFPTGGILCNNLGAVPHTFQSKSCSKIQEVRDSEASILLPDLNLPFEDEPGSAILYGMS